MADVLLSLTLPNDVAQHVEDLLLSRPIWSPASPPASPKATVVVPLVEPGELVAGHSPRTQIRMVGPEENMRAVLALLKTQLPRANLFYWLVPVIEMGRL
ncbi:MAG: DUF3240 family protein [Dechloromonas sp.]|nr:MAG: DUF3240 family protein [Dechloromonas sp.]